MAKQKVIRSTLEGPIEAEVQDVCGGSARCRTLVFIILVLTDVADFVSDWLFFVDVYIVEKGLVYGPVDRAAVWSLLAFSIVGTITFVAEVSNLWLEKYRDRPWVDSDVLSAVVIWVEDIPQIIISLTIALCREEPISIFQLTKAAVVLFGIAVRIILSLIKYCNKRELRSQHHVKYKVVIMVGIILEALIAGSIFFLTQTERGDTGGASFKVPTTVIEDRYNDQQYFANVSIFLHHAELFNAGQLDPNTGDYILNWIRLSSINKIRDSPSHRVEFRIDYEYKTSQQNILKFAVWEKLVDTTKQWDLTECYEIDQGTAGITEVPISMCQQAAYFVNPNTATLALVYTSPGVLFRKKVFGDIMFNMKLQLSSGQCSVLTNYTDSIEGSLNKKIPITLHYYRVDANLPPQNTRHMFHDPSNPAIPAGFFRNDGIFLEDITEVWKTGWNRCDSTGSLAPNLDHGIQVDCGRV